MLNELIKVTIRALISLITLFLVTKMLGKKQVSQLSLFDYVIGISIGNFAAELTVNLDSNVLHGTLAVIIFGLVAYLISILTMKSIALRRFFMGIPTVIIHDGNLILDGLKKVKYDINDLLEQCRSQGFFDISEIAYAIMEADGKLSILPKAEYKAVTIKDMNLKTKKSSLCANVIIDGNIMKKNLENMGKTYEWLEKELKNKGKKLNNILLGTLDNYEKLNLYEKNNIKIKDILE